MGVHKLAAYIQRMHYKFIDFLPRDFCFCLSSFILDFAPILSVSICGKKIAFDSLRIFTLCITYVPYISNHRAFNWFQWLENNNCEKKDSTYHYVS